MASPVTAATTRARWEHAANLARALVATGCLVLVVYGVVEGRFRLDPADPAGEAGAAVTLLQEVPQVRAKASSERTFAMCFASC